MSGVATSGNTAAHGDLAADCSCLDRVRIKELLWHMHPHPLLPLSAEGLACVGINALQFYKLRKLAVS